METETAALPFGKAAVFESRFLCIRVHASVQRVHGVPDLLDDIGGLGFGAAVEATMFVSGDGRQKNTQAITKAWVFVRTEEPSPCLTIMPI